MSGTAMIVERLSKLLRDEISAIGAGQLETVRELYPQKVALLQELEAVSDRMEAQLSGGGQPANALREQLETLQALLRQDHALLESMTAATGRVAEELARIRDRYGLGGIYGKSGSLRNSGVPKSQQVDQSI